MLNGKGSTKKSNLEGFLHCTTPLVPPQSLPKGEIRSLNGLWHPWEREKVEFFRLSDLWDCYDEWSAYGASVPVHLTNDMDPEENGGHKDRMRKEGEHITLSPFGMATHKMQGNVWLSHDQDDQERLVSLFSVADSWLKQLRVQHHDFNYFCTISMTYRA